MRDKIIEALQKVSGKKEIHLEFPERLLFGDYSSNIALKSGNPRKRAQEIVEKLKEDKSLEEVVGKIEIAGPGFINFHLNTKSLTNALSQILEEKEKYGESHFMKGKKIMFEYGDANTHKLPHIGHLFSYIYAESTTRILESAGAKVYRVCYQGDVGLHVAKCLWAFEREKPQVPDSLEEKVFLLQKMYTKGSVAFEENKEAQEEITKVNQMIYARDKSVYKLWQETRGWNIKYYDQFEKLLGIKYDRHYYESEVYEKGADIVKKNIGKVFVRSQGAVIFPGSKYMLHDRVFITRHDTPTYEAKDMYLQELKMEEWPCDLIIISTASEQNGYFAVVFKALEMLNKNFIGKLKHIGFGMINLKSGKMSSRTGNIISAIDLIEEVLKEVEKINKDKKIAQEVSLGAIKYSFLKNNPLKDMSFAIEESIAKEGNSGPYLQYTYARTQSVLKKAKKKAKVSEVRGEENEVVRQLMRFPEVIQRAAVDFEPNILCSYLYDVASSYNAYYNRNRIIGAGDEELRLALTAAVGQVIKNGLSLLGIAAPEKM